MENKNKEMSNYLLISDAAKEVSVETHVLRYWEEELHLPIKRNELGHRYYTGEDVEQFKRIKSMKERGLQLKAIKMILKDGKLDVITNDAEYRQERNVEEGGVAENNAVKKNIDEKDVMLSSVVENSVVENNTVEQNAKESGMCIVENAEVTVATQEDKSKRLQWLLQQLIRETLRENNQEICREIKESVIKELDYQFRLMEEHEEQRDEQQIKRTEEYYKKMDELLRKKTKKNRHFF